MKNLFIVIPLLWMLPVIYGQHPGNTHINEGCHAAFIFEPDPHNPMQIHFEDRSTGQINSWQWSFGDGSTSVLQHPSHTYMAGGTYFVCLTISNSGGGGPCHDILCRVVTVHEPGKCIADYRSDPDPVNPMLVHFNDKSSGNINRWHWTFGDGASSDDRNPGHLYMQPGKYQVCLTAYNQDSVAVCNDTRCDSVECIPGPVCVASFTAILDSGNRLPRSYRFRSTSSGFPTTFKWNFGDGKTAQGPESDHRFSSAGTYKVCLEIARFDGPVLVCSDSTCMMLTMPDYFDLGGHLFTGTNPINNPYPTGDTGVAYLYRKKGNDLVLLDTNRFTQLGYYAFPQVLSGSYLVKAALTRGSISYPNFLPTYFQDQLHWKSARELALKAGNNFSSHIYMVEADTLAKGECTISGSVVWGEPGRKDEAVPFCEVILFNDQLRPVMADLTDHAGHYRFRDLPFGAYYLYAEMPGKFSRMTAAWLDQSITQLEQVELGVFDYDVTGISQSFARGIQVGALYPNPAGELVNMTVWSEKPVPLLFQWMDLQGRLLKTIDGSCPAGISVQTVPSGFLPAGIYFLKILAGDHPVPMIRKVIR